MDGTVHEGGGQYELRFERHLKHPVEKVWAALTDPEHRDEWLALDTSEPRADDRATSPVTAVPEKQHSAVRTVDPPRLLEYSRTTEAGHEEPVRWELFPEADGTRLVLTHTIRRPIPRGFGLEVQNSTMPSRQAGALAHWHGQLDSLALFLTGQPAVFSLADWAELYLRYLNATGSRVALTR